MDGISVHTQFEKGFRVFQTQPQQRELVIDIGQSLRVDNAAELTRINSWRLVISFYESGIALILDDVFDLFITFIAYVPRTYEDRTQGFLGNLDGNFDNEFHTRDNTNPIPNTGTDRLIYLHLEEHCE